VAVNELRHHRRPDVICDSRAAGIFKDLRFNNPVDQREIARRQWCCFSQAVSLNKQGNYHQIGRLRSLQHTVVHRRVELGPKCEVTNRRKR